MRLLCSDQGHCYQICSIIQFVRCIRLTKVEQHITALCYVALSLSSIGSSHSACGERCVGVVHFDCCSLWPRNCRGFVCRCASLFLLYFAFLIPNNFYNSWSYKMRLLENNYIAHEINYIYASQQKWQQRIINTTFQPNSYFKSSWKCKINKTNEKKFNYW